MVTFNEYTSNVNRIAVYVAMKNDTISFQNCLDAVIEHYEPSMAGTMLNSFVIGKMANTVWAALVEALGESDFIERNEYE